MFIIRHKNIFFTLSASLVILALFSIFYFGLNLGIDFKGGSILEVSYPAQVPVKAGVESALGFLNSPSLSVQPVGAKGYIIKTRTLSEAERGQALSALSFGGQNIVKEERFSSIGPSIGRDLARKGITAMAIVIFLIIAFIAFVFRSVSRPVASWKYGVVAVIALCHDVIIPTGIFAFLSFFKNNELDALFLTAILTILTLSVNDTIVIFDRVRENLKNRISSDFEETVGLSLNETFRRSLISSLTIIFAVLALYFFGGESTRNFSLILAIGMFFGTYSSIFLAAPLLTVWHNLAAKKAPR